MDNTPLTIENNATLLLFLRMWNSSGSIAVKMATDLQKESEQRGIILPVLPERKIFDELKQFHTSLGEILDIITVE
ncbi:MAG TPA: hypothetical protein EYQ53_00180 [Candidatus Poseidoniales archaeon]|jgi:hypothetical protein|nr:MAG: hypothetical protein CXT69_04000 [Euryarchaeota archaeon]HIG02790.1 hypothetical protein [Candidatus Poseidoniales archaeon]HIK78236.1 hypothetical protein [Candidatus Poseidoniales archaeon]